MSIFYCDLNVNSDLICSTTTVVWQLESLGRLSSHVLNSHSMPFDRNSVNSVNANYSSLGEIGLQIECGYRNGTNRLLSNRLRLKEILNRGDVLMDINGY